ncbi:hypothetical protein [Thioflexithrix psekupsensis]|uniref:Uncharacterized protein n=1 Tax=Thioflexithrix psekupsensis TaxID=1570016 RepID=A0A251X651_9GAMM|nr:hypothetical protein [Thioflexithrix psekupsensis]OUD13118.1 hypothetical protein TPSD3_10755 [Thioflexithrix psekupsensis]
MHYCQGTALEALIILLKRFDIQLKMVESNQAIEGSYWGESEAGLVGNVLYVRNDTPIHSALHEACHYICMDSARRTALHTDAGGDYAEENAVCYLQILLANHLPEMSADVLCEDMDNWGYSFRLGNAKRWFNEDAQDAYDWLLNHQLIAADKTVLWRVRN